MPHTPSEVLATVQALLRSHGAWYDGQCLLLEGATGAPNPKIFSHPLLASSSMMGHRPSLGLPFAKHETGLQYCDEIEVMASQLLQQLFQVRHAEVRVLSGCQAVQVALCALTEPNDPILSLPADLGGHVSHHMKGVAGLIGRKVHELPIGNRNAFEIDMDSLHYTMETVKAKALLIGSSLPLRSFPLRKLRTICDAHGAKLIFDAAHVTGMIAGEQFQSVDDLKCAHAVTSSSYKSFNGPPGGFVLTDDDEIFDRIQRVVFPGLTANTNLSRFPWLCVSTADLISFGQDYASTCVANANRLAKELCDEQGIPMFTPHRQKGNGDCKRFTDSHIITMDVRLFGGGATAAKLLERANILTSPIDFPQPAKHATGYGSTTSPGVRLAVQDLTRRGMGAADMAEVARLVADVMHKRHEPEVVKERCIEMRMRFGDEGIRFVH